MENRGEVPYDREFFRLVEFMDSNNIPQEQFFQPFFSYFHHQITFPQFLKQIGGRLREALKLIFQNVNIQEEFIDVALKNVCESESETQSNESDDESEGEYELAMFNNNNRSPVIDVNDNSFLPPLSSPPREMKSNKKIEGKKKKNKEKDNKGCQKVTSDWTEDEEKKLIEFAEKVKDRNRWNTIARLLGPTKTAQQCSQHYQRVINPIINKDKWTFKEEKIIAQYTQAFSKTKVSWAKLAKLLPGRTDTLVRYKYKAMVKALKLPWREEDSETLVRLAQTFGKNWEVISKKLSVRINNRRARRTPYECMAHYEIAKRDS